MEKVHRLLKDADAWFIATIDGGRPRVRPFAPLNIFEGRLYFMTARSKAVSKQIAVNNRVEISAMSAADRWIRVSATAIDDDRIVAKESFLAANPDLADIHRADDPDTQVLYLTDATATIESFGGEKEVIEF